MFIRYTKRVVTETRNLKTLPFIIPENTNIVGKEWEEWLEGIIRELRYFTISDPIEDALITILYGGKDIARLEKSLPNPTEGNDYKKMKTKLNNNFNPKQNKYHTRYQFLEIKPKVG